jgi:hypothetical protein
MKKERKKNCERRRRKEKQTNERNKEIERIK